MIKEICTQQNHCFATGCAECILIILALYIIFRGYYKLTLFLSKIYSNFHRFTSQFHILLDNKFYNEQTSKKLFFFGKNNTFSCILFQSKGSIYESRIDRRINCCCKKISKKITWFKKTKNFYFFFLNSGKQFTILINS